jgi:hypothetical protein
MVICRCWRWCFYWWCWWCLMLYVECHSYCYYSFYYDIVFWCWCCCFRIQHQHGAPGRRLPVLPVRRGARVFYLSFPRGQTYRNGFIPVPVRQKRVVG